MVIYRCEIFYKRVILVGKTLVINMKDIEIEGNILDVGEKNLGIIYNISKEVYDEISVDYVSEGREERLQLENYDACTFFFELNNIWTYFEKERIIQRVTDYIKDFGKIYIWDINKQRGKFFNNKVKIIMPKGTIRQFTFKNLNPLSSNNCDEIKKIVEKNFKIEETKVWEDIFFIKATKMPKLRKEEEKTINESITYSY